MVSLSAKGGSDESDGTAGKSLDDAFFAEGTRRSSMPPPPIESEPDDARSVRLRQDPEVLARRAKSVRLVRGVVLAFGLLFAVAIVVRLMEQPPPAPPAPVFAPQASAAPVVTAGTPAKAVPAAVAAVQVADAAAQVAADAAAQVAADAAAQVAADAAAQVAADAAAQVAADAGPAKDAKALKRATQKALDASKFAEAIENGEAAVEADPTDAEAWLLLGAAYDAKGRGADARRAYQSCMSKGKRGPTAECAALLR